ncbi:unnamed protein product [Heligmosomoides polygyrus]|uniref:Neur_chan_LBD domain-containing protein n=1 Tax=Heligmosomoides polygyrus TaxID=6339 RepID=A0A183GWL6_HELPZ|nr:unnamed protein product [Heligmosomoides polygyrus]
MLSGPPIEVNITAHITTISSITEVSMDYTLDLYLRQIWKDPRLAWESDVQSSLTIGEEVAPSLLWSHSSGVWSARTLPSALFTALIRLLCVFPVRFF